MKGGPDDSTSDELVVREDLVDSRTRLVSLLFSTIAVTLQADIDGARQQCNRQIAHTGPQKVAGGDISTMQLLS